MTRPRYEAMVERSKEYIRAGDIFQVVISQRLEVPVRVPAFDIYRALRVVNPSPYMYYLRMGDSTVLGSSPEMLVKVSGREVEYRPIAGTRPRGKTEEEDKRLEEELRADAKERAEHIMLVDLGRNDIGRVCEFSRVRPKEIMFVERYSHVMHLVSSITRPVAPGRGQLRRAGRLLSRRHAHRRAQGPRHGDHRRTRTYTPRALRRRRALSRLLRQSQLLHRHPHRANQR